MGFATKLKKNWQKVGKTHKMIKKLIKKNEKTRDIHQF
jgi:hypothetical protein